MFRNPRRRDPAVQPKIRIELKEGNIPLRLMIVGIAILTAVLAFGAVVNGLTQTKAGWQQIAPANPESHITQDFLLCYNVGQTQMSAGDEVKALATHYSELLEHGYRVLSNTEQKSDVNLYTLNRQPNTAMAVDELLYEALETLEASGSRMIYFAPLVEQYWSLFSSTYDQEAEQYDPDRSGEAAAFAEEIAAFALDSEAIQLKLLPENTVRLEISPDYLSFARENGVESFVDFGLLLNAFLCDAVADGLEALGFSNGYVTSFDGFTRALCDDEFALNVFGRAESQPAQLGTVLYHTPGAIVSCRSFPIMENDSVIYYTYQDGTVLAPYLNAQGRLRCAADSLNIFSENLSTADLALRTLAAFAGEDPEFRSLEDLSWVAGEGSQIILHGNAFALPE